MPPNPSATVPPRPPPPSASECGHVRARGGAAGGASPAHTCILDFQPADLLCSQFLSKPRWVVLCCPSQPTDVWSGPKPESASPASLQSRRGEAPWGSRWREPAGSGLGCGEENSAPCLAHGPGCPDLPGQLRPQRTAAACKPVLVTGRPRGTAPLLRGSFHPPVQHPALPSAVSVNYSSRTHLTLDGHSGCFCFVVINDAVLPVPPTRGSQSSQHHVARVAAVTWV